MISSDSSDGNVEDFGKDVEDLSHKDPGVKLFAAGKLMRILNTYTEGKTEINPLDRRLIKGFYTTDHWELEHD